MTGRVALLRQSVEAIAQRKHPGRLLEDDEAIAFLTQDGIRYGRFSLSSGAVFGFTQAGAAEITTLAAELRQADSDYKRGASLTTFAAAVAGKVLDRFGEPAAPTVTADHLAALEADLRVWFAGAAVPRTHYVPCAVLAERVSPFAVGPVTFVHASELATHPRWFVAPELAEVTLNPLYRALSERAATWVAIVEVSGCDPALSSERADLAVDVALAAVQLVVPPAYGRPISRVTGRTAPAWRGNLFVTNGQVSAGIENNEAGHGLSGPAFEQMLGNGSDVLVSAGKSIDAFLTGLGGLTTLRQAWCDGAYWFHEALLEPLGTVASTKFETAVEALLHAESTPGSEARIKTAVKALAGLAPKDLLPGSSTLTVEKFAKELVAARSRVLHGTLSTLLADVTAERDSLAHLARDLLLLLAVHLDAFEASPNAKDDRNSLLDWVDAARTTASMPMQAATNHAT